VVAAAVRARVNVEAMVRALTVAPTAILAAATVWTGGSASAFTRDPAAVFFNELHYDNRGVDQNEAVEIAGPAETDLTGWRLVLYNGSDGSDYFTRQLSGMIPDQGGGFGAILIGLPTANLQNGAPDGLALVDAAGQVVQLLSYEGAFRASSGPAAGLDSTDIGVLEPGNTAQGQSLQLQGQGTVYQDFTWVGPAASSYGAPNQEQTFLREPGPVTACLAPPEDAPVTAIASVQGTTDQSPLVDDRVTVRGTIMASFQDDLAGESEPDLERLEGMLVTFPEPLTVTGTQNLGIFGELVLADGGRLFNPTNAIDPNEPDNSAVGAAAEANRRRQILLDDGSDRRNPDPLPFLAEGVPPRASDTVSGLTGILGFGFRSYRVYPVEAVAIERDNPRTARPAEVGGSHRIAAFNVLNYFTTLGERGAETAAELDRQAAKLVAALGAIDADVVGLIELQNNGGIAIGDLVGRLNVAVGTDLRRLTCPLLRWRTTRSRSA